MKAIIVKYVGPREVRGSRYIAKDSDGNRAVVEIKPELGADMNKLCAVKKLCAKMKWSGIVYQGELKAGESVFVWAQAGYEMIIKKEEVS